MVRLFPSGGHPSMLTNSEEFSKLAKDFLSDCLDANDTSGREF